MTPHFLKWSFGPKMESVDGICQQTDSKNRFYLDVKTGPESKKKMIVHFGFSALTCFLVARSTFFVCFVIVYYLPHQTQISNG